jgi:TDG/mug DNA glycosylase family protein
VYTPDILAEGLDVIFCGINPAATAAADGHNFSSPSNRFWPVLHEAGFTDRRLRPEEERDLLRYRYGLTAVVTRPTARAGEVSTAEFRSAKPVFEAKMQRYAPRVVAFLGKRALAAMLGNPEIAWGRQDAAFAGLTAWVLPNPSGLNRAFTLPALVAAYAELHAATATS